MSMYFSATADTTLHIVILQNFPALLNQLVAHTFGKTADVCLLFGHAEYILHPAVGVFLC